ncbi:MAG: hypothetical protein O2856_09120 [Planctomycetota bacterium]|nr:hypothetical protein [Planctomycetota bacterium]
MLNSYSDSMELHRLPGIAQKMCVALRFARTAGNCVVWLCIVCMFSGCHNWQKSHETAVSQFGHGDIELSRTALRESLNKSRSEKKLLELDSGILDLASGNVTQAEAHFRTLRRELEHLEQKDVTERASSMLTDSRAIAYSGRDFERRMILNMALLTSLLGDGQDAFAYSLQATEAANNRRTMLVDAAQKTPEANVLAEAAPTPDQLDVITPVSHAVERQAVNIVASPLDQPLALSSYLATAVQSENSMRYDETEQAMSDIGFWNPAFRRHDQAASRGEFGTRCQPGNGTLHVITLVGKAPRWESESAEPTSAALLIADRIISATGKHTLPPTIASVKIARPEIYGHTMPTGSVQCLVGPHGAPAKNSTPMTFSTVVDVNAVALASYREHRDAEIAQAITRRVFKKGAVYVLKEVQNVHRNSYVDLGINVAGVAWEAMEKADTRSWRMLPARIDIARTELPAGQWSVALRVSQYGSSSALQSIPVYIENGRNTYIVCLIPDHQITGNILVGGADNATFPVTP